MPAQTYPGGEPYSVDAELAESAAEIVDEIQPGGPYLDGSDALIAAVGRQLDAPVVSSDGDLTHRRRRSSSQSKRIDTEIQRGVQPRYDTME